MKNSLSGNGKHQLFSSVASVRIYRVVAKYESWDIHSTPGPLDFQFTISFICLRFSSILSLIYIYIYVVCLQWFRHPRFHSCFTNKNLSSSYLPVILIICPQPVPGMCSNLERTKKREFASIKGFIQTSLSVQGKG